jgi:hypothetical protein
MSWHSRYWGHLAIITLAWLTALGTVLAHSQPAARHGYAAHYRKNLMEQVAIRRGLPPGSHYVASPHDAIGQRLEVCRARRCERVVVADVPHPRDRDRIIRRGIVTELSWPLAQRLCGLQYVGQEPPSACPVTVRRLP